MTSRTILFLNKLKLSYKSENNFVVYIFRYKFMSMNPPPTTLERAMNLYCIATMYSHHLIPPGPLPQYGSCEVYCKHLNSQ